MKNLFVVDYWTLRSWKCNCSYLFCVVSVNVWFYQNRLRSCGSLLRCHVFGFHCLECTSRGGCSFMSPVLWPDGICKQAISLSGKDGRAAKAIDLSQILRRRMKAWTWIWGMVAAMSEGAWKYNSINTQWKTEQTALHFNESKIFIKKHNISLINARA